MDPVFERTKLVDTDGSARMHTTGGDTDFGAKTKFSPVGELRRGIMQHNR